MGYPRLKLCILDGNYAICRLSCKRNIPEWAANEPLVSVTSSEKELTIVCEQRLAPDDCEKSMDWKCIKRAKGCRSCGRAFSDRDSRICSSPCPCPFLSRKGLQL